MFWGARHLGYINLLTLAVPLHKNMNEHYEHYFLGPSSLLISCCKFLMNLLATLTA